MRITYKVLWVEDQKEWYEETKGLIEDYLYELGFILEPKLCKSFDEVKEEFSKNQLKEYDLLLIDFRLAGSPNGDEIIKFIRTQRDVSILTDVIFYSTDIEAVRTSLKENGFEGVYTSPRRGFTDKAEKVIDSTVKKVQEVNSMRGLIMAETSDLDDLMLSIIQKMLNTDKRVVYERYILEKIISTAQANIDAANKEEPVENKIQNTRIFTSTHKAMCINKLYKETKKSGTPIGIDEFYESYRKSIISVRNNFAHVKETIENGEKVLVSHSSGVKEVFNERKCIEIRHKLINFRKVLEAIDESMHLKVSQKFYKLETWQSETKN